VAADSVQVRALRRNGVCVLQIAGDLDTMGADAFAERADEAVRSLPWPVLVDLSGLTFIDARGARVLDAVMRTLPGGQAAIVRACPRRVRRILDILGVSLAGWAAPGSPHAPRPDMPALVDEVRRARLRAGEAKLDISGTLAELADTRIRLAATIERAGLIREQGRQTLARSQADREQSLCSRSALLPGTPARSAKVLTGCQPVPPSGNETRPQREGG
jgi:anti-anti-sigma factor